VSWLVGQGLLRGLIVVEQHDQTHTASTDGTHSEPVQGQTREAVGYRTLHTLGMARWTAATVPHTSRGDVTDNHHREAHPSSTG